MAAPEFPTPRRMLRLGRTRNRPPPVGGSRRPGSGPVCFREDVALAALGRGHGLHRAVPRGRNPAVLPCRTLRGEAF